jgi:D-methionine transport system permease protein
MIFGVSYARILLCVWQTLYMLGIGLFIGTAAGLPIGILLVITRKNGIMENKVIHTALSIIINIVRSVPFIILLVYVMPVTKLIVGTRVGSTAAIVPLVFFITPFLSRLFESSLLDIDSGIIEAARAMGATVAQTIIHFMLPEARSSLILALTTGAVSLLGATAMAGAVGGGGVGDLALTYGYQQFNHPLMTSTVIVLIIFVQILQTAGNSISRKLRNGKK